MQRFCLISHSSKNQTGFTLIELIAVVVILSILAVMGSSFMLTTAESYHQTSNRAKLVQQGRLAIEQMTRRLRESVPNSVRVSSNQLCVEWLPLSAGGIYLNELPDAENTATATTVIDTGPLIFNTGNNSQYAVVAALSATEIYNASPAAASLVASVNTSAVPNTITLTAAKQFARNSVTRRIYLADFPERYCILNNQLRWFSGYTASGSFPPVALNETAPNAGILVADNVTLSGETPFTVINATETRNTLVQFEIPFSRGGESIVLEHEVMIRNVP